MSRTKVLICLGTLSLTALLLTACDNPLPTPPPTIEVSLPAAITDLPPTAAAPTATLNEPRGGGSPPPGADTPLPTSNVPPPPPPPPPGS